MDCDGSTTDDDATEDEEEKMPVDVTSESNGNDEKIKAKCQNDPKHGLRGSEATFSVSENETSTEEWHKGLSCLAPYSGDNEYYEAVINSIQTTSEGHREAVVTFIGYESEGSERVPVKALRTIGKQPDKMTKSGNLKKEGAVSSTRKRKKGKLDVSIQHKRTLRGSRKSKTNDSDLVGGITHDRPTKSPNTPSRQRNGSFDDVDKKSDDENTFDKEMIADGFDDQDMERPSFSVPAPHPLVPLVLSDAGVQPVTQVPATINRYLREYQRDGVRFLYQHFTENTGAILGDDMGLGKTVQVISFIAAVLGKTGTKADIFCKFMDGKTKGKVKEDASRRERGTFLIVSPGSVLYNWKDELETWGNFNTGLFHGNAKEDTLQRAFRGRLDVVLTTYETMRNHLDDLNKINWLAVIMDEVHRLKDRKAQITVAAKALTVKRRYGLTGTPLQNKLGEFWCVLDWANQGSLGKAKRFDREFGKPIREGQTYDATKRELALARKKSKELQDKIGRFFLRRTKDLIADQLPSKDELVVFCPLTPFQEDAYQTLLQNPDVELIRKKNFPCDCGSGVDRGKCCYMLSSDSEDIKTVTMRFFQLLLKVANHAALLAPTVKQTLDQQEKAKELYLQVFARYPEFSGVTELSSFELLSDPKYCGKMKVLDKLLRIFREEHSKVLLFSRSTQLLDILEEFVISKGLVYSRLDGGTKPADRTRLVREFNLDPSISLCLISTKAGGLGLNFTGANVVIIFDPNWNPSSDMQAQDRAYRIGQRRDVRVYRLISSGTIEEMIYLRQVYKQQLANIAIKGTNERRYFTGVEGDKDRKGELFGLENLFSYRAEGASLSKDIVKRAQKLEAGYKVAKYEIVPEKKQEDDLESKVTEDSVDPNEDEDPYNLEEIASQFIDDDGPPLTKLSTDKELHNAASTQVKSVENYDGKNVRALDNHTSSFDDVEDLLRQELTDYEACSKCATPKCMDSSVNTAARKPMSFEDFFSEDEDSEPESSTNNYTRIKKARSRGTAAGTGDAENVIPSTVSEKESSSSSCEEEYVEPNSPANCFTKVKEKVRRSKRKNTEDESYDVIPPTVSLACGTKSSARKVEEFCVDDSETSPTGRENVSGMSSSSEEDSDEGLFTRRKEKGKRKPKIVVSEPSNILKEGRKRLRRFPGKLAPNVERNSESLTAKRSKKDNKVEEILESCGVRYTHANKHIVGSSEAEDHMSKQALQDVFELRQFSQQPANCFPALETSEESDDLGENAQISKPEVAKTTEQPEAGDSRKNPPSSNRPVNSGGDATVERIRSSTVFVGSTPRGIRRQHFREMSEQLGFSSEIDLARAVVTSSGTERQEMLKRFYLNKNPEFSSLSCFTAHEEKSRFENVRQDLKRGKRPLERTRENESLETSKKSKRNVNIGRTKVKLLGKDTIPEKNRETHDIQRQNDDDSFGRKLCCSATVFEEKQGANLKTNAHVVELKGPFNDLAKKEEDVTSVNTGNGTSKAKDGHLSKRSHLQQKDRKCSSPSSAASELNRENTAEIQDSSLNNTSAFSVSILDEFLSRSSCRGGTNSENVRKNVNKVNSCADEKEEKKGKELNKTTGHKKTVRKKKSTSVLDDFI